MRKPRKIVPGAYYHVIARANRQEFILESDSMKEMLLGVIVAARAKFRFAIQSICIMSNHIHMLVHPHPGESLSRIMQWILSVFAMRFNRRFGLRGHVWYDRFKSAVLDTLCKFVRTFVYIEENPVRAGMVSDARAYRYSSWHAENSAMRRVLKPPDVLHRLLFPGHLGSSELISGPVPNAHL